MPYRIPIYLEYLYYFTGVKIMRGPWARGPYLGGRAPRLPSLGAREAVRNRRGQNIENEKKCDISTPGPTDSDKGS